MTSRNHRYIKELVYKRVFEGDLAAEKEIRTKAQKVGIWLDSTYKLYGEMSVGRVGGFTVPAINIRTLTFDIASLLFGVVKELNVGPVVFEIARSEIGYTNQPIGEYTVVVLAAALAEKYRGAVFVQADHFQVSAKKYFGPTPDRTKELGDLQMLIMDALAGDVRNIDIDTSTLVQLDRPDIAWQQRYNIKETAALARLIRRFRPSSMPSDMTVTIGGEIGEVGKENSTPEELEVFVRGVHEELGPDLKGLSKVSVQTGTAHGRGGIVDFNLLTRLSQKAKEMGVVTVQHGASTLPLDNFDRFPETGCAEIHLATEFQNIVLKHLPKDLRERMEEMSREEYRGEIKKTLGPFKRELWNLPQEVKDPIMAELKERFRLLFQKLRVANTRHIIDKLYPARR